MDNLFLLLLLVSFVCLIIGLVKPTVFSRFIKGEITRKKIGLIFGIATVAFFVMFGMITDTSKQTQSNTNEKVAEQKTEPKQLSPEEQAKKAEEEATAKKVAEDARIKAELHYEIINEKFQGSVAIITVFTTDKEDEKIIRINDKLLEKYKENRTHIFINYYDDKEADPTTPHYIAKFIYNTTNGYKELVRIKDSTEIKLKTY